MSSQVLPSPWRPLFSVCGVSALLIATGPALRAQPADPNQIPLAAPATQSPSDTPLLSPSNGSATALPASEEQTPSLSVPSNIAPSPTASAALPLPGAANLPQDAAGSTNAPLAPPMMSPPVVLSHPEVINAATVAGDGRTLSLFGITDIGRQHAQGLKTFIQAAGDQLTCTAQPGSDYICRLPNGTDIALVALVNGAAQARDDASDQYHEQERVAQAARRGIWAGLPPPPVPVEHPTVQDTATLVVAQSVYRLDGIEGITGPHAMELQSYIEAHGDSLVCQQQGSGAYYTCLTQDGTDLAKVVLVNGAAHVTRDAPDAYGSQQQEAIANRRGIWATMTPTAVVSYQTAALPQRENAALTQEPGVAADGVTYVGGQPTAVIDGGIVFLAFAGAAGWGYYDHFHHWHGAPERFAHHLERFHPEGRGLRGYGPEREAHLRGEGIRPAGFREATFQHPAAGAFTSRPNVAPAMPPRPVAANGAFGHPAMQFARNGQPGVMATPTARAAGPSPKTTAVACCKKH